MTSAEDHRAKNKVVKIVDVKLDHPVFFERSAQSDRADGVNNGNANTNMNGSSTMPVLRACAGGPTA